MKKVDKVAVKCDSCGANLLVYPCLMKRSKKHFCNVDCKNNWFRENAKGKEAPHWKGGFVKTTCDQCGRTLYRSKTKMKRNKHNFCNEKCGAKWKSQNFKGPLIYNWKERISVLCDQCGKEILRLKTRAELYEHNFCNRACMAKWHSENLCKENSYQWRGGILTLRERLRKNPKARLNARMASGIGASLKGNKKGRSWEKLVGYSCEQLMIKLKKTIPSGYTWDDFMRGDLEIDHIIPQVIFNFTKPEHIDFRKCWHIKNLQLLPAKENRQKGAKIQIPFQPSLALRVSI